jgi:hypothetical protein
MVRSYMSQFLFAAASEEELNLIVEGHAIRAALPWAGRNTIIKMPPGTTGVIWKDTSHSDELARPIALISQMADHRRLFGRFAQLRSDLSPLSTWCHIITPSRLESMEDLTRDAFLNGYEAAWTGLIVAEALLLANLPISKLKLAACLATQSFAVGRSKAAWYPISTTEILERYDSAQSIFRTTEQRANRLRTTLEPIWSVLSDASLEIGHSHDNAAQPLLLALRSLKKARYARDPDEGARFADPLEHIVPEARILRNLLNLTPEQRVREFDTLISSLSQLPPNTSPLHRHSLAMLAGYLATVVAGGSPSLALVEDSGKRWPEITAWAYLLGGIGERVVWTSGFDGLGRLVARELMRPLRLDEPPTCDFAIDEAQILFDPALSNPLVNLRIKQSRVATVSLVTGVNLAVSIGDQKSFDEREISRDVGERSDSRQPQLGDDLWRSVADAVWPYLQDRMGLRSNNERQDQYRERNYSKNRSNKRPSNQSKLPLRNPDDR